MAVATSDRLAVGVHWCATCGDRTAHERRASLLGKLALALGATGAGIARACVRCTGRAARKSSLLRRWFDGQTVIDPL
jgi:hypothetical protein